MTRLIGATVQQFKDAIETMRKAYPFEDDRTKIVSETDPYYNSHSFLEVTTTDIPTGVKVNLSKEIKIEEDW